MHKGFPLCNNLKITPVNFLNFIQGAKKKKVITFLHHIRIRILHNCHHQIYQVSKSLDLRSHGISVNCQSSVVFTLKGSNTTLLIQSEDIPKECHKLARAYSKRMTGIKEG